MASTAIITPQRDGTALFELNGITHEFPNYAEAQWEAYVRGIPCIVERFPTPAAVVVIWEAERRTEPRPLRWLRRITRRLR